MGLADRGSGSLGTSMSYGQKPNGVRVPALRPLCAVGVVMLTRQAFVVVDDGS